MDGWRDGFRGFPLKLNYTKKLAWEASAFSSDSPLHVPGVS